MCPRRGCGASKEEQEKYNRQMSAWQARVEAAQQKIDALKSEIEGKRMQLQAKQMQLKKLLEARPPRRSGRGCSSQRGVRAYAPVKRWGGILIPFRPLRTMQPQPPSLTYATPRTDATILYALDGQGGTVVIRRGRNARSTAAIRATASTLGELALIDPTIYFFLLIGLVFLRLKLGGWIQTGLVAMGGFAGLAAAIFLIAWLWYRFLERSIVIELTSKELMFRHLHGDEGTPRRIRRELIYAIKYSPTAGQLVVRVRGGETLYECRPVKDPERLDEIAAFLRKAMGWQGAAGHTTDED